MIDHLDRNTNNSKDFQDLCRTRGIPLTWQRKAVLAELRRRVDHPAADQIHEALRAEHPGISRTTVYRVLETLVGLGVVVRASHPGAAARFDAVTDPHHHRLCTSCGRLEDVPPTDVLALEVEVDLPAGYAPHDYSIYFRGTCAACAAAGSPDAAKSKKEEKPS
jgi:Fur family peroxide stress response transcriptional regulator